MGRLEPSTVFVLGASHSGTTILDMAIGAAADAVSTGELNKLPRRIGTDHACTCGQPMAGCNFWNAVDRTVRDTIGIGIDALRLADDVAHNDALYTAIRTNAGCSIVVDSSKKARRVRRIVGGLAGDTLIVHIVRDVRSWVVSQQHAAVRNHLETSPRKLAPKPLGRKWVRTFLRQARLALSGTYVRIRYEDLCAEPAAALAPVFDALGIEHAATRQLSGTYHLAGGNRAGHTAHTIEPAMETWHDDTGRTDLSQYGVAAAWLARRLGYH